MATITTGLKISISNTPQAKDDVCATGEDLTSLLNVLANDLGGTAKTLYSLSSELTVEDGGTATAASMISGPIVQSITTALGATATIVDGMISYSTNNLDSLPHGVSATDVFSYVIRLSSGAFSIATVTITVTGTNDVPVATAASTALSEDSSVLGSVSATDADAGETATLTYALVDPGTAPAGLTFNADGTYSFDASSYDYLVDGEEIELVIAFTASDAMSTSAPANLTITVTGTNDVPVAAAAIDSVVEDAMILTGSVSATDDDAGETATLTYELVDPAPEGLIFNSDGSYSFDASSYDYLSEGVEFDLVIPFVAKDALSTSVPANLVITITGTNDAAILSADVEELTETDAAADISTSGTLTIDDVDSAEEFVAQAETPGTYGTFAIGTDGAWTYTATSAHDEFVGGVTYTDTFSVASADGTLTSVTINILGTNDAAILSADVEELTETNAATDISTSGTLTISDVDSAEEFVAQAGTPGTYGTFAIGTDGAWTYTATSAHDEFVDGVTYTDTFSVESADGTLTSVTVKIHGTNDAAILSADLEELTETDAAADISTSGTLTISDVDSSEEFVAQAGAGGTYGTFAIGTDGAWTYTATSAHDEFVDGVTYTDTFSVASADGTLTSVTINILGTNDMPVAAATSDEVIEDFLIVAGSVSATDADAGETASLIYALVDPAPAGLSFNDDGSYSFDASSYDFLEEDEVLVLAIPYTASDATSTSAPANLVITVTGTNDAPAISLGATDADAATLAESDVALIASGTLTARDPDLGDTVRADVIGVSASGPVSGFAPTDAELLAMFSLSPTMRFDADATDSGNLAWSFDSGVQAFDYLPDGESLVVTYTVKIADEHGVYDTHEVAITITGSNDAPFIAEYGGDMTLVDDGLLEQQTGGLIGFGDYDTGDTHLVSAAPLGDFYVGSFAAELGNSGQVPWSFSVDRSEIAHLADGEELVQSYEVTITDAAGATATQTVTVTIVGANDVAVITGDVTGSVTEDAAIDQATGLLFVDDADDGENSFTPVVLQGAYGSLTLLATGQWTYALDNDDPDLANLDSGEQDSDTFEVTSFDGTTASIAVTVHGNDDIPPETRVNDAADDMDFDNYKDVAALAHLSMNTLSNSQGADLMVGNNNATGTETINGLGGNDIIHGAGGMDAINGNNNDDTLYGGAGVDTISGGGGADSIYGGSGGDTLRGDGGSEIIRGGSGDDMITGGGAGDELWGGTGADSFIFAQNESLVAARDSINDFSHAEGDKIDLTAILAFEAGDWLGQLPNAAAMVSGGLGYVVNGDGSLTVFGDHNGDGVSDLAINVWGVGSLQVSDFSFAP